MRGRPSRRFAAAFMSGLIAATMGVTLAATAAAAPIPVQDPVPIGPNEYFSGFINNHPPGKAVIKVICPGPGTTGHPAASQQIEVKTAQPTSTFDIGFTGSAGKKITATLLRGCCDPHGPGQVHQLLRAEEDPGQHHRAVLGHRDGRLRPLAQFHGQIREVAGDVRQHRDLSTGPGPRTCAAGLPPGTGPAVLPGPGPQAGRRPGGTVS